MIAVGVQRCKQGIEALQTDDKRPKTNPFPDDNSGKGLLFLRRKHQGVVLPRCFIRLRML
ncbi:hypothetical protein HMPREF0658_0913 [Hoylesella marshii DSM 16973 = JCM 13450]|uniref:Uncharacterized protein n=1 Tax=Hoylesella marshii DSM 16973 = JCM 13450 TaxID=862515 RepID=E0NRW2_9BACT|nr:hypothetical protein HMPREF0658_0913 [Hoylesella marshii DSM 16973 = JCM 13450]